MSVIVWRFYLFFRDFTIIIFRENKLLDKNIYKVICSDQKLGINLTVTNKISERLQSTSSTISILINTRSNIPKPKSHGSVLRIRCTSNVFTAKLWNSTKNCSVKSISFCVVEPYSINFIEILNSAHFVLELSPIYFLALPPRQWVKYFILLKYALETVLTSKQLLSDLIFLWKMEFQCPSNSSLTKIYGNNNFGTQLFVSKTSFWNNLKDEKMKWKIKNFSSINVFPKSYSVLIALPKCYVRFVTHAQKTT